MFGKFKFNKLELARDKNLKIYTKKEKWLKLEVRNYFRGGLIPIFIEVTGEKLVG